MAIQVRRGPLSQFDPSKMKSGEWGITTDDSVIDQKAFITFAPGQTKQIGTYEDMDRVMKDMVREQVDDINESVETCTSSASSASNSSSSASTSALNASKSESNAKASENSSKSYAVGGTGTRTGEDSDNAKYYADQAKKSVSALTNAYTDMGTIAFANLPTSGVQVGHVYNVSDAFTTDERFREGAGKNYAAGTNIVWTTDNLWDAQAGESSIVSVRKNNIHLEQCVESPMLLVDWEKNLFNATATTMTKNGVTCTRNADGTFTLDGTPSELTIFDLGTFAFEGNTDYMLSGTPEGGSANGYFMYLAGEGNYETGNGMHVKYETDSTKLVRIVISVNTAVNNLVFKPMIEKGKVKHSYVPYVGYTITASNEDGTQTNSVTVTNTLPAPQFMRTYDGITNVTNEYTAEMDIGYASNNLGVALIKTTVDSVAKLGNSDISEIGDGTVTGAINSLEENTVKTSEIIDNVADMQMLDEGSGFVAGAKATGDGFKNTIFKKIVVFSNVSFNSQETKTYDLASLIDYGYAITGIELLIDGSGCEWFNHMLDFSSHLFVKNGFSSALTVSIVARLTLTNSSIVSQN